MRDLWLITKILLKSSMRSLGGKHASLKTAGILLLLVIGFGPMMIMFYFSYYSMFLMKAYSLGLQTGLLLICMITGFVVLFAFASSFYFSEDTKHLIVLPVKSYAITGAKLVSLYGDCLFFIFMSAAPLCAAWILSNAGNWLSALFLIFSSMVIVPGILLLVMGIITLVVMRLMPLFANKDRFNLVAGLMMVAAALSFAAMSSSMGKLNSPEDLAAILTSQEWLIPAAKVIFQIQLSTEVILNGSLSSLLLLAGSFLLLCVLFFKLADWLYLPVISTMKTGSSKSRRLKQSDLKDSSYLKTSMKVEFLQVWRSPTYAVNVLLASIIVPLVWLLLMFIADRDDHFTLMTRSLDLSGLPLAAIAFLLGVFISLFVGSASSFCSTAISRKGVQGVRFMCQIPVSMKEQLNGILAVGTVISFVGSMCMLLLLHYAFVYPWWLDFIFAIGAILGCILDNIVGLIADLWRPKLVWESETAAVKNNLNTLIGLMISIAYMALSIIPLIIAASMAGGILAIVPYLNWYALFQLVVLVLFIILTYRSMVKHARSNLMKAV